MLAQSENLIERNRQANELRDTEYEEFQGRLLLNFHFQTSGIRKFDLFSGLAIDRINLLLEI